jgi:hypothetical protein
VYVTLTAEAKYRGARCWALAREIAACLRSAPARVELGARVRKEELRVGFPASVRDAAATPGADVEKSTAIGWREGGGPIAVRNNYIGQYVTSQSARTNCFIRR